MQQNWNSQNLSIDDISWNFLNGNKPPPHNVPPNNIVIGYPPPPPNVPINQSSLAFSFDQVSNDLNFYRMLHSYNTRSPRLISFHDTLIKFKLLHNKHIPPVTLPVRQYPNSVNSLRTINEDVERLMELLQESQRLPDDIVPILYRLKNVPFHWGNATFLGELSLHFRVKKETKFIVMHAVDLELDENSLTVRIIKKKNYICFLSCLW